MRKNRKTRIITMLCSIFLAGPIFAQEETNHHNGGCGIENPNETYFKYHPEMRKKVEQQDAIFQRKYEQNLLQNISSRGDEATIIPVVVHIIHNGGPENISDQQVFRALEELNADFNAENDAIDDVIDEFVDDVGNMNIEFRLAQRDIDGNCHPGITRTQDDINYVRIFNENGLFALSDSIVEVVSNVHGSWPQNRYMNIYVYSSLVTKRGTIAGFAPFPSHFQNANEMEGGVYMANTRFGDEGTASAQERHVLAHEVGHWLNLSHTWGNVAIGSEDACSFDDFVEDTPNTIGSRTCDLTARTCNTLDNTQNFMNYADCRLMFTNGQIIRMQTALETETAGRNNLCTPKNLFQTGVVPEYLSARNSENPLKNLALSGVATQSSVEFEGGQNVQ